MAASDGRDALQRDLEGYAVASCLVTLDDARLNEHGQAWAGSIVQRSRGPIEPFIAVYEVVKVEMPMFMRRDEANPRVAQPMPVMYCAELIDAPAIRAALSVATQQLREDYEGSR